MCSICCKPWLLSLAIKFYGGREDFRVRADACALSSRQGKSSLALRFCQGRFNPYHEDGMWNLTVSTPNRSNWSTFDIFWHLLTSFDSCERIVSFEFNYLHSNSFMLLLGWKFLKWRNLREKFSTVDCLYSVLFLSSTFCHRWIGYHWCCLLAADCAITQLGWVSPASEHELCRGNRRICAGDGGQLKLHVWDTGGQDSEGLNQTNHHQLYLGNP